MTGLPKLPGFTFSDPTISRFNLSNQFEFINGYKIPKPPEKGVGGKELDVNGVAYIQNHDTIRFDPSLTYGRVRGITLPQYIPHFAQYDQKCLTFKAFFKQTVIESPNEHYRIRHVNIIYFLENDTMTVMEPRVRNSGIDQGRLVRRSKIPKNEHGECWSWKDLNIGIDLCINGIVYHTVDCDAFTREYMASQGILLNPTEDVPPDPYTQHREMSNAPTTTKTPASDDKLRRFLEYDGKILKFSAAWDNRDSEYGELKEYIILYFLSDDTISVKEVHKPNDGCDPCPLLLRKTRLPKNWKDRPVTYPACCLELSEAEVTEYYQPKDLRIGETIFVLGRRFLLYDCDLFTRNYYEKVLNIKQGAPIKVFETEKPYVPRRIPPHEGLALGSLEDSMQNCFQTIPTRPRRDEVRMMLNANKCLRYTMEYDWVHPEDSIRKFVLFYSLSHGTIQIHEPPIRNSGIMGGKFLRDMLIAKPGSDAQDPNYYTPADFYIGARIEVNGHRFIITGADLYVYRYMMANPEKFSQEVIDNMRNYMYKKGYLEADIREKMEENEEIRRREAIEKIGSELETIKTEREKCVEMYEQQRIEAARRVEHLKKSKQAIGRLDVEPILDTRGHPYDHEIIKEAPYGIKAINRECQYPVFVGDIKPSECVEGQYESGVYTVKYPDTEEETLKKHYDKVLSQHEKACLEAAKYKETHECLPGTQFKETDEPKLSEKILVSEIEKPSPEKYNPCKKQVRFAEPLEKCAQDKQDPCNLKIEKDHCDCTYYDK